MRVGKLRGVVADQAPPDTTVVVAVALLFNGTRSGVAATTRAVFVMVPGAALVSTLTTIVKVATAPAAKLVAVQATAPVAPTEGVVQVKIGPVF